MQYVEHSVDFTDKTGYNQMHQISEASTAETSASHTPYNRSQYHSHDPAKERKPGEN